MKRCRTLPAASWSAQNCLERARTYPLLYTPSFANKHGNNEQ
jgi:hypothetical protein